MPISRSYFEYQALKEHAKYAPSFLPAIYYRDEKMALTIMEYLNPHIIPRKGLMQGIEYPFMAEHLGKYLAYTLYHTSDFHLPAASKRENIITFAHNSAMCSISENLIFDEPSLRVP